MAKILYNIFAIEKVTESVEGLRRRIVPAQTHQVFISPTQKMRSWTDSDYRSDRPFSENKAPTRCPPLDPTGAGDPSVTPDTLRAFTLPTM